MTTGGRTIDTDARDEAAAPVDLSGVAALRSVLRIRPFRRLWLVLSVASFGDWLGPLGPPLFAPQKGTRRAPPGGAVRRPHALPLGPGPLPGPPARGSGG